MQLLKSDCRDESGAYPRQVEENRCPDLPTDLAGDNLRGRKRGCPMGSVQYETLAAVAAQMNRCCELCPAELTMFRVSDLVHTFYA